MRQVSLGMNSVELKFIAILSGFSRSFFFFKQACRLIGLGSQIMAASV